MIFREQRHLYNVFKVLYKLDVISFEMLIAVRVDEMEKMSQKIVCTSV